MPLVYLGQTFTVRMFPLPKAGPKRIVNDIPVL